MLLRLLAVWRYFCSSMLVLLQSAVVCSCLLMLLLAAWRYSCMPLAAACLQPECSGAATAACGLACSACSLCVTAVCGLALLFACSLLLPDAVCCGCCCNLLPLLLLQLAAASACRLLLSSCSPLCSCCCYCSAGAALYAAWCCMHVLPVEGLDPFFFIYLHFAHGPNATAIGRELHERAGGPITTPWL